MKITSKNAALLSVKGLLIVAVTKSDLKSGVKSSILKELEQRSKISFSKILKSEMFSCGGGEVSFHREVGALNCKAVLFVGVPEIENKNEAFRLLGSYSAKQALKYKIGSISFVSSDINKLQKSEIQSYIEGALLSEYSFVKYKSVRELKKQKGKLQSIHFVTSKKIEASIGARAESFVAATNLARDLVNTPATDCNSRYMIKTARSVAKKAKLKIQILDKAKLTKMKAGGILGVNKGSGEPPALVKLTYKTRGKPKKIISLVGKGVTFDSGGLSIKVGGGMNDMKCDMAGAAAVLGIMSTLSVIKPNVEVRAYIPLAENMINEKSYKLGDVLRMLSGKTVEILNTDAEGRLIMADAIALANKEGCDEIIDIATLTGACMVALGDDYAGVFTKDRKNAEAIIEAGSVAGEPLWHMPLAEEYRSQLKSSVADIKNIGSGRMGGAITAGLFLSEFSGDTPLIHIDIAGPAFRASAGNYYPVGATGFGVRTLANYLA